MSNSIGMAINIYQDANALPGCLEHAARFFDSIWCLHAGPGGKRSTDGTIEILEKFGVRTEFCAIDDGYGVIRTRLLRMADTEWTWISDADERFFSWLPEYSVHGSGQYPADPVPDLHVGIADSCYSQGELLRHKLSHDCKDADALRTVRRHWMNLNMSRPCQDWTKIEDWQLRCLRNRPYIYYLPEVKMHERLIDKRTGRDPIYGTSNVRKGPFHDHFHVPFKLMEPEQRAHDIRIYDSLCQGGPVPTE